MVTEPEGFDHRSPLLVSAFHIQILGRATYVFGAIPGNTGAPNKTEQAVAAEFVEDVAGLSNRLACRLTFYVGETCIMLLSIPTQERTGWRTNLFGRRQ